MTADKGDWRKYRKIIYLFKSFGFMKSDYVERTVVNRWFCLDCRCCIEEELFDGEDRERFFKRIVQHYRYVHPDKFVMGLLGDDVYY